MPEFGEAEDTEGFAESAEVKELSDGAPLLAMLSDEGKAYFLTEYAQDGRADKMYFKSGNTVYIVTPDNAFLKAFASDKSIRKYTHDVKRSTRQLLMPDQSLRICFMDTLLAAYLLNPSASGYDPLRLMSEYSVKTEQNDNGMIALLASFPALCAKMESETDKNDQRELLSDIEIPLAEVLADMEREGFAVNRQGIEDFR